MSFGGYQDLGFNKLLLVEGPTDIKTFQQFLRLYKKDHEVIILPLGGNNFINANAEEQLLEIGRISSDVSAVIDSERNGPGGPLSPNRRAFVDLCGKVGIDCHVLNRRSTENYLSDSAIKKIKGPTHSALGECQELGAAFAKWGKSENWRIAREMTRDELDATDLGEFLRALRRHSVVEESRYDAPFCSFPRKCSMNGERA